MEDDETTLELILEATYAGAYRALAREFPDHAGGFLKLAARHSERVVALADEVFRGAERLERNPAPPFTRENPRRAR